MSTPSVFPPSEMPIVKDRASRTRRSTPKTPLPPPKDLGAPFLEDDDQAYGAPSDNLMVRGDHLDAIGAMTGKFLGRFRCAYLDPPYNTGRTFDHYEDAWEPDAWRNMLTDLLDAVHPLLAEDGALFLQIGDAELGQAITVADRIFGRKNRRSIVTVVRSAATGHKAQNPGPVNVSEFLLLYAKDRKIWRGVPQVKAREDLDPAYSTFLMNPEAPPRSWRYEPLARVFSRTVGHDSPRTAARAMGRAAYEGELRRFALRESARVVRFAQPRYEAIGAEARRWVDRSRGEPDVTMIFPREKHKDLILRNGDRVLFLADKVREIDGEREVVEALTNVWTDSGYQGIAREGGARFPRSKKPEKLIARVLSMATQPGDWVLDPCLGSGTTAAVAHKMGRQYVGIERGRQMDEIALPRLRRVVDGDDPSGITRKVGWQGGGGFRVFI